MNKRLRGKNSFKVMLFLPVFLLVGASASPAVDVEVLFVYDTTASAWVRENGGMSTFSQKALEKFNEVLEASQIEHRARVAHSMAIDYATVSLDIDREAMRSGAGPFAEVHAARNMYNADIVALLVDTGSAWGVTGSGDSLNSWSGSPDSAYAVNAIRAVDQGYTLVHELGHIFGAHHSKLQTNQPGPNTNLPGATYSAGWYFQGADGLNYNTVMAYSDDGMGNYYALAPIFSSPLLTYMGTIAGHPEDGDNRRMLIEAFPIIASYRTGGQGVQVIMPAIQLLLQKK